MKNMIAIIVKGAALLAAPALHAADAKKEAQVKRGEHLVKAGLCADCHTPKKMGPNGPEEDLSRTLSGTRQVT